MSGKCKYPDEVCGNQTLYHGKIYCDSVPCSMKDELPPQTNGDYIRGMDDEKLAGFIGSDLPIFRTCKEQFDWLRQPK